MNNKLVTNYPLRRLKFALTLNDGGVWGEDEGYGDVDLVILRSTEQEVDGSWNIQNPAIRGLTFAESSKVLLQTDDVLITKSSGSQDHIGKTSLVTQEVASLNCGFSNFMQRLRVSKSLDAKFLVYLLNSTVGRGQFRWASTTTTGLGNLSANILHNILVPSPDISTQELIADYLDRETARIDSLIAEKERMLALLEEKRAALISQAVTRGLAPDVPLKPSDLDCLGDVAGDNGVTPTFSESLPPEWVEKRLKYAAPLRIERVEATSEHRKYLGLENIQSWTGKLLPTKIDESVARKDSEGGKAISFQKDDVLFGKLRPYLAKAFHADKSGFCSTEFLVLKPQPDLHPEFLLYSMLSPEFVGLVNASTFGAKMPRANWDFIGSMSIPVPGLDIQQRIANYLDRETAHIDTLVAEIERTLVLLKEKRSALITAAVTGQLTQEDMAA